MKTIAHVIPHSHGDAITTKGTPAKIALIEDEHARAAFGVEHVMRIPACADSELQRAMQDMRLRAARVIGRSEEMAELRIRVVFSLSRSGKQVEVKVELDNNAKDHRLRMLIPTDAAGSFHYADSVFDLVKRPDVPGPDWVNPSRCDRMQMYAAAADDWGGMGVANRGLYEYEMLDERRTMAVTLLRCVGELADWGVFPTPDAQCPGRYEMDLALIPLENEAAVTEGFRAANEFQTQLGTTCIRESDGQLPSRKSFLNWQGDNLICTCFKAAADGEGLILRLFNAGNEPSVLTVQSDMRILKSDIMETSGEAIEPEEGAVRVPVGGKEIITLWLRGRR